jgi:hypothetical protein
MKHVNRLVQRQRSRKFGDGRNVAVIGVRRLSCDRTKQKKESHEGSRIRPLHAVRPTATGRTHAASSAPSRRLQTGRVIAIVPPSHSLPVDSEPSGPVASADASGPLVLAAAIGQAMPLQYGFVLAEAGVGQQ